MSDDVEQIPFLAGSGRYRIDVVGESFYEDSFAALCGERTYDGVKIKVIAHLLLQDDNPYDKHAVGVMIQGYQVGHLSRALARAFRRTVRYGAMSIHERFECAAIICGGWDRGDDDVAAYGVRLDLNLTDD